jgi:carbon-monoxide dehydrogenase medium subunit
VSIIHDFTYVRPEEINEALALLAEHGAGAEVLAGGTDEIAWLREDMVTPGILVDIKRIPGLAGIEAKDGMLVIGALVTFTDLIESPVITEIMPLLAEMAHTVASPGIRNRATVAGNICSAVPSADASPVLVALEAEVVLAGPDGERRVPIDEWFVAPRRTVRRDGELVTAIEVPIPPEGHGGAYVKLGRYEGEDLAQVAVGVVATPGPTYRISFGAVAPVPIRARRIEAALNGAPPDATAMAAARALIPEEISPISDVRASKEYRMHMTGVMLERGLKAALQRLSGDGPTYGTRLI